MQRAPEDEGAFAVSCGALAGGGQGHEWLDPTWPLTSPCSGLCRMFATAQKTQELWMWKMEYLHHEQRPLYFGEWF